ncbi:MAG: hypothetical protein AAF555_09750 [Verrucomicrobiota bacterium]
MNPSPPSPSPTLSLPQPELRFTRSAWASLLGLLAAGFFCGAMVGSAWAFHLQTERGEFGLLSWLAIVGPIASASTLLWLSRWLAKRTYLLLSGVGVEVFPLFKPEDRLEVFPWDEVAEARVLESPRALHLTLASQAEFRIPLGALRPDSCQLLQTAVAGRTRELQERAKKP